MIHPLRCKVSYIWVLRICLEGRIHFLRKHSDFYDKCEGEWSILLGFPALKPCVQDMLCTGKGGAQSENKFGNKKIIQAHTVYSCVGQIDCCKSLEDQTES